MEESKEAGPILGGSPESKIPAYNDIANDPEMAGLTLYEKKALLVNRELDSHGMGKYQWYQILDYTMLPALMEFRSIFILCGMGYFIDLLYAQAFGLVAPAMKQELGFSSASPQTCLQPAAC